MQLKFAISIVDTYTIPKLYSLVKNNGAAKMNI
jgi:hypothetical protein